MQKPASADVLFIFYCATEISGFMEKIAGELESVSENYISNTK